MKFQKIMIIISSLSIFSALVSMILVFFWMLYPYKTLEFQDEVFPVVKKVVNRGEMVYYTSNYCKFFNFPALVTRSFINEIIYVTPSTITNRPSGCHTIKIGVVVPKELPPSNYKLEMTYQIEVNPIRVITIKEDTEMFTVK